MKPSSSKKWVIWAAGGGFIFLVLLIAAISNLAAHKTRIHRSPRRIPRPQFQFRLLQKKPNHPTQEVLSLAIKIVPLKSRDLTCINGYLRC